LTGAGDTGLQYHRAGLRTWLITRFPPGDTAELPDDVTAVAIAAGSRHLEPEAAAERSAAAARWLADAGCQEFYLKIDSTLRGNVGAGIRGLLAELGLDLAVVAPAFPEHGRTTIGGFQLVAGTPVALTEYGADPIAPASESHVPTVAATSGLPVTSIDLRTVLAGWEAVAGAIARAKAAGMRVVVVDAARTADLEQIARAVWRLGYRVLPVGSAGLAAALMAVRPKKATPMQLDRPGRREFGPPAGRVLGRTPPILIVSGSPNPTTLEQIQHLGATARLVLVDVRHLLLLDQPGGAAGWELHSELAMAARQALQGLIAGRDVIVTTAISPEQVEKDRELGRTLGITGSQVGRSLSRGLGALARHLHEQAALGGVVAAGGETAAAICEALPGERLEIVAEVVPAVPLSRVVGRNLRLVTKSGGFGSPDTLRVIVEYLRQTEEVA